MKILHLASFVGNIGDVANHEGLYAQLRKMLKCELQIDQLEMRLFYFNNQQRKFDQDFATLANNYDLFIIGGGNFFELCWDYSHTGTTFDISKEVLSKIDTPILINGIGIDVEKGYNASTIEKFNSFLRQLFSTNKVFFTVRNDGSKEVVNQFFKEFSDKIHVIPDYGFFLAEVPEIKGFEPLTSQKYIGINVAVDMSEIRYKNRSYENFITNLSVVINEVLDKYDVNIYLFPHIQSDYFAIVDVLKHVKNYYVRSRISIGSLVVGNELETFKHYKECKLVLGMRNHSTICAVGLGIPSFGMTSYPKPEYIYREIGLTDRFYNISEDDFFVKLSLEIGSVLENDPYNLSIKENYKVALQNLLYQRDSICILMEDWFRKQNLL